MSHWVVHEILNTTLTKPRKSLIKKFIEIAKVNKKDNIIFCLYLLTIV
jgi:hypothetical protein